MDLKTKVVVVIGGAGVIGRDICRQLAAEDAVVVIADINEKSGRRLSESMQASSGQMSEFMPVDITIAESIGSLIDKTLKKYQKIDAVINAAYPRGTNYGHKLEEVYYQDFCSSIDLHIGGYFLVMKEFCLAFRQQGYGNVINFSSIYGFYAPDFSVYEGTPMTMPVEYAAIKSAIIQLSRYFAKYFKKDSIRVNCISPGGILDAQPDSFLDKYNAKCMLKGMLDPADLYGTVRFLLSEGAMHITGQNLVIDDGFTL